MKHLSSLLLFASVTVAMSLGASAASGLPKASGRADMRSSRLEARAARPASASRSVVPPVHKPTDATPFYRTAARSGSVRNAAANTKLPDLEGLVIYNTAWGEYYRDYGFYTVPTSAAGVFEKVLPTPGVMGPQYAVEVDGICYVHDMADFWGFQEWSIYGFDPKTGERLFKTEVDPTLVGPDGTVDPTTGDVYLLAYNSDATGFNLSKLAYDNQTVTAQVIAQIGRYNALACDNTGQLYAIGYDGYLYKMDKTTAQATKIGDTGFRPVYMASATIDQRTNRMFWNVCDVDDNGVLVEVNLETGEATLVYDFPENNEIIGLHTVSYAEPGAPAAATDLKATFYDASLTGSFSFNAPITTYDGEPASGNLTYNIYANDEEIAAGICSYGETVTEAVTVENPGYYVFSVVTSNQTGQSPRAKIRYYLGYAVPEAPTGVSAVRAGNTVTISWKPVTKAATAGLFRSEDVRYKVVRNDGTVVAENLAVTSCTDQLDQEGDVEIYSYSVFADHHGLNSGAAISNDVSFGFTNTPWGVDFSGMDNLSQFTILDENHDGRTWDLTYDAAFVFYNPDIMMDDWLITPGLNLEYGKAYRVNFEICCQDPNYLEKIEVKYGKDVTVAAMQNTLLAPTDVRTVLPKAYNTDLIPEETGVYYIGFHGISPANGYYLKIKSISVSEGTSVLVPAEVTDLAIEATEPFALTVNGSFTAPSLNLAGDALEAIEKIVLSRDGDVIKTFLTPPPGAQLTFTDEVTEDGSYTYSVVSYNESGESPVCESEVFIGATLGAAPSGVELVETTTGMVKLTWDPVTEDINGGPLPVDGVSYVIVGPSGNIVADNVTETEYSARVGSMTSQTFAQFGVAVRTRAGVGAVRFSEAVPAGGAYKSMNESFVDGTTGYIWGIGNVVGNASWHIANDYYFTDVTSSDYDNGMLFMEGLYKNNSADFISGKVRLPSERPALSFRVYNTVSDDISATDDNAIEIFVREPAGEWASVYQNSPAQIGAGKTGWSKATVYLSDYADKIIQFRIKATTISSTYTFFDDIRIGSVVDRDLELVTVIAPSRVVPGNPFTIDAIVSNEGTETIEGHSIEFYVNGELYDDFPCDELAPGDHFLVTFGCDMHVLADEALELKVVGVYDEDENKANNESAEIIVEPVISTLPYVTDLRGEADGSKVNLTWTEPDADNYYLSSEVDFEDGTSFAPEYLDWIFVDVDQSPVGGIGDIELPGITATQSLMPFFVMDCSFEGLGPTLVGHSGNKSIVSMYRSDGGITDDWAISPELCGTRQMISFYAQSYDGDYPERMEMYYSTGSIDPKDFVKVTGVERVPEGWNLYSFEVPDGAKRFAIRSNSVDAFLLMLDDFNFADKNAERGVPVSGYNVYRDGAKLNREPVRTTAYTDADRNSGVYVVTALYDRLGESRGSNKAEVNVTGLTDVSSTVLVRAAAGLIEISGAEGMPVAVYSLDGMTLFATDAAPVRLTLSVAEGVYLVKAGDCVAKVAVR